MLHIARARVYTRTRILKSQILIICLSSVIGDSSVKYKSFSYNQTETIFSLIFQ